MSEAILRQKIARLEFEHDQLLAELHHVDEMLRSVGFSEGLETVKGVMNEIIEKGIELE